MALLVAAAAIGVQYHLNRDPVERYDRYVLPGFDAYVYMAMADHPGFFTLPPWGYRILTPWIVHSLPVESTATAFRVVTEGGLILAAGLLFLFLRRLGHGRGPSLLAVLAFSFSNPVREAVRYQFLSDPLSLCLEIGLLLVLEAGAEIGFLALLLLLGSLAKADEFLLLAPGIYFARRDRDGHGAALIKAAGAAVPAVFVSIVLRRWWAPPPPSPSWPSEAVWLGVYRILAGWEEWWWQAALFGLTPLALLGALRGLGRPFVRRYGYFLLVTVAVAFVAAVYTLDTHEVPFFPADIPRLLIYSLPLLLPLGLTAVDRIWPHIGQETPPVAAAGPLRVAAAFATLVLMFLPFASQDRYRRVDLQGVRDGRLVLALCRESLGFAKRLERGKPVAFRCEERRFKSVGSDPRYLESMRWFLRRGWGVRPQYGIGPVVMEGRDATLLLPCFRPAAWNLILSLAAPEELHLRVRLNDHALAEVSLGAEVSRHQILAPASALFRGDNELRFEIVGDRGVRARLVDLVIHPVPAAGLGAIESP